MITFLGFAAMTAICAYMVLLFWPKHRFFAAQFAGATTLSFAIALVWASDSLGFSDIVKSDVERRMADGARGGN